MRKEVFMARCSWRRAYRDHTSIALVATADRASTVDTVVQTRVYAFYDALLWPSPAVLSSQHLSAILHSNS